MKAPERVADSRPCDGSRHGQDETTALVTFPTMANPSHPIYSRGGSVPVRGTLPPYVVGGRPGTYRNPLKINDLNSSRQAAQAGNWEHVDKWPKATAGAGLRGFLYVPGLGIFCREPRELLFLVSVEQFKTRGTIDFTGFSICSRLRPMPGNIMWLIADCCHW